MARDDYMSMQSELVSSKNEIAISTDKILKIQKELDNQKSINKNNQLIIKSQKKEIND